MSEYQRVCETGDLSPGQSQVFALKGVQVAVFNVAGEYFALRNECPHAGASLAHGMLEGDVVRCRIHHWGFCVRDGRYVDQNLPQYDAGVIPLRLNGTQVEICVDPSPGNGERNPNH